MVRDSASLHQASASSSDAMDDLTLRPPAPFTDPVRSIPSILFRHPGYANPTDILLRLPRLDAGGVHHRTALLACQIVADNAFDGYLTTDREGQDRVKTALDGVLRAESYWFVAPGQEAEAEEAVYPVVPRFEDWRFPHNQMTNLAAWESTSQSASESHRAALATNPEPSSMAPPPPPTPSNIERCILSSHAFGGTNSHIIPSAQSDWFANNSMVVYNKKVGRSVHDERNIVRMRQDLHNHWDAFDFALVPKRRGSTNVFVAHVLKTSEPELIELASYLHNTPVRDCAIDGAAKAFLLAKSAPPSIHSVAILLTSFTGLPKLYSCSSNPSFRKRPWHEDSQRSRCGWPVAQEIQWKRGPHGWKPTSCGGVMVAEGPGARVRVRAAERDHGHEYPVPRTVQNSTRKRLDGTG